MLQQESAYKYAKAKHLSGGMIVDLFAHSPEEGCVTNHAVILKVREILVDGHSKVSVDCYDLQDHTHIYDVVFNLKDRVVYYTNA